MCANERKEREGGIERRRKSCGRGRSGGRETDRNEMEGLKDKERGEGGEGRGGKGNERLSEHVRGGKREKEKEREGMYGGCAGERQKDSE